MSRGNTTAMDAALAAQVKRLAILGDFDFDSGVVRLWSGEGTLAWGAESYLGVGSLLGVEFPEENGDGAANGATFTLSGVDGSWVSLGLTENYQGRACTLYYGLLDGAGALVADPVPFFPGVMDRMDIDDAGDTCVVRLSVERSALDNRAPGGLYDDETQQRLFAGDRGFEFVAGLEEKAIHWGVPGALPAPRVPIPLPGGRER